MNQEKKTISWTEESRFTIQMKYSVDALNDLLRKKEQDFASAQDKITKAEERRAFLEDRIPASEQFAKSIVQESLPRVNTKIGEYVLEKQQEIEALNKKIQELQEEYARIQGALIIFGKRAKLEKLDADIEEVKAKVIPLQTQLDEQKKILSMRQDGKEDDEILAWMKQVSVYIKKVQDEVRLCSNAKEEYSRFFNELSESDDNIKAAYEGYHRVEAEQYSEEIKKTIQYLYEQLEKYSLVNIYQQIYDESVQVFKEKNGVKSITGKCHRYDLYVQLMFAMKYFNKKIGNMQFICVDEGQDLAVNEYRLLSELNQNHVVFNIFGDTNQLMKSGRGISDWNGLARAVNSEQWYRNIILHDSMYSCDKLLEYVYPELAKQNSWKLPVWYYIANSDYKSSLAESKAPHSYNDIVSEDSIKRNRTAIAGRTAMEIWTQEKTNVFKAIRLLGFLPEDKIDVEQYQQILETIFKENANILSSSNTSDRSSLKRMIRIYDFLLYRQKKTP